MPLNLFTLQSLIRGIKVIVDFVIIWVLVYYLLKIVRNNSRTVQIFKGIVLVVAMQVIANTAGFTTTRALLDFVIQYGVLVVVIIFQQEIRALLEKLGKTSVFSALHSLSGNEKERLIEELVTAATDLSDKKIGALMSLEQGHSLMDYIKTGTAINATVSADILTSIFVTSTPLHDGAVIIQGDRIACASAYFPPTNLDLPTRYGARHRAALGISEVSDSVTIVVSEETGTISIAENGKLREMDETSLREYLNLLIQNSEQEVSHSLEKSRKRKFNLGRLNFDPIKVEKLESISEETNDKPASKSKLKNPFTSFFNKKDSKKDDFLDKEDEMDSKEKENIRKNAVQDGGESDEGKES